MTSDRWIYAVSGIGLLVLIYAALALRGASKLQRIKKARKGETIETFVGQFAGVGWSKAVLEMAYADLVESSRFPVHRTDDLEHTLGLLPEEFEMVLKKRCDGLGLTDVWKSPHASRFPLRTAEDYVRFLSAVTEEQRRRNGLTAEIEPAPSKPSK